MAKRASNPAAETRRGYRANHLTDADKAAVIKAMQQQPGHCYGSWEEACSYAQSQTGLELKETNLRHLRTAFELDFTVNGDRGAKQTPMDAGALRRIEVLQEAADLRLAKIEEQLIAIRAAVDEWA